MRLKLFDPNFFQEILWNKWNENDIIEYIWFDLIHKKDIGSVEKAIRDDYIPYWTKNPKGKGDGIIGNPFWTEKALNKIYQKMPGRKYEKSQISRKKKNCNMNMLFLVNYCAVHCFFIVKKSRILQKTSFTVL